MVSHLRLFLKIFAHNESPVQERVYCPMVSIEFDILLKDMDRPLQT